jgi:hypothetical protein
MERPRTSVSSWRGERNKELPRSDEPSLNANERHTTGIHEKDMPMIKHAGSKLLICGAVLLGPAVAAAETRYETVCYTYVITYDVCLSLDDHSYGCVPQQHAEYVFECKQIAVEVPSSGVDAQQYGDAIAECTQSCIQNEIAACETTYDAAYTQCSYAAVSCTRTTWGTASTALQNFKSVKNIWGDIPIVGPIVNFVTQADVIELAVDVGYMAGAYNQCYSLETQCENQAAATLNQCSKAAMALGPSNCGC